MFFDMAVLSQVSECNFMADWRFYLRKPMDVGYICTGMLPIFVIWCRIRIYKNNSCTIALNSVKSLQMVNFQLG